VNHCYIYESLININDSYYNHIIDRDCEYKIKSCYEFLGSIRYVS
jgi:hypothetical protein